MLTCLLRLFNRLKEILLRPASELQLLERKQQHKADVASCHAKIHANASPLEDASATDRALTG